MIEKLNPSIPLSLGDLPNKINEIIDVVNAGARREASQMGYTEVGERLEAIFTPEYCAHLASIERAIDDAKQYRPKSASLGDLDCTCLPNLTDMDCRAHGAGNTSVLGDPEE